MNAEKKLISILKLLSVLAVVVILLLMAVAVLYYHPVSIQVEANSEKEKELVQAKSGIHAPTGFIDDKDLELVIANCTVCHSAKLVTQNRATREGWLNMIRWMQRTQGLWDLGENEDQILDYLVRNYAPESVGRRANLQKIEWYPLDN